MKVNEPLQAKLEAETEDILKYLFFSFFKQIRLEIFMHSRQFACFSRSGHVCKLPVLPKMTKFLYERLLFHKFYFIREIT